MASRRCRRSTGPGATRTGIPMQWESEPLGGFTKAAPWLSLTDPEHRSVASQRGAAGSLLELHRELIARRRELSGPVEAEASQGRLALRRGDHEVVLDLDA